MPLLLRRAAVQKFSLRSLKTLHSRFFRAFDPMRGGRLPPRAPPLKTAADPVQRDIFDKLRADGIFPSALFRFLSSAPQMASISLIFTGRPSFRDFAAAAAIRMGYSPSSPVTRGSVSWSTASEKARCSAAKASAYRSHMIL